MSCHGVFCLSVLHRLVCGSSLLRCGVVQLVRVRVLVVVARVGRVATPTFRRSDLVFFRQVAYRTGERGR